MMRFIKVFLVSLVLIVFSSAQKVYAATAPDLGVADSYSVFGKAGVTNDTGGTTHIWGNVGADLLTSITNLIASQVDGTILGPAAGVQSAASAAYDTLDLGTQGTPVALNLSGPNTVTPGVYTVGATTLNDTLTLDGAGVYIFRSSSSISTSGAGTMNLINGATACNVFWQIPTSMTIGANAHIEGTIIAQTGLISLGSGATLKGRAFSLISQVTLLLNQITQPHCVSASSSSSSSSSSTSSTTSTSSVGSAAVCISTSELTTVPTTILTTKRLSPTSVYITWGPYAGNTDFNVRYGKTNGEWLYNYDFTGFSATIAGLEPNQPYWFQVSARNNCLIGTYGPAKLVGGPSLPNAGFGPVSNNFLLWLFQLAGRFSY